MSEAYLGGAGDKSEARYGWSKAPITGYTTSSNPVILGGETSSTVKAYIADSFDAATLMLINPVEITITPSVTTIPANKYIATTATGIVKYKTLATCTAGTYNSTYKWIQFSGSANSYAATIGAIVACVVDDDTSAYGAGAFLYIDGYKYIPVVT